MLLIRGGVYADMDVLLETNLDDAVANDIGFMTPIDEVSYGVPNVIYFLLRLKRQPRLKQIASSCFISAWH